MFFRQLFNPSPSALTYLVTGDTRHEAVFIDPAAEQVGLPVRGSPVRA